MHQPPSKKATTSAPLGSFPVLEKFDYDAPAARSLNQDYLGKKTQKNARLIPHAVGRVSSLDKLVSGATGTRVQDTRPKIGFSLQMAVRLPL